MNILAGFHYTVHKKMHRIGCIILLLYTGLHAEPPLTVTYSPQNICVLTGSSVLLTCSYTLPQYYYFKEGYWYKTDGQTHSTHSTSIHNILQASGTRIEYNYYSSECRVRISNLIPSDSGVYDYRIKTITTTLQGKDGVTLSVSDVPRKDCWGVSYSSTSFCVLRGSTVDIPCTYGFPTDQTVITTLWYRVNKKRQDPIDLRLEEDYEGRVEHLSTEERNCTLRIRDVRETDLGQYRFRYKTNTRGGGFTGNLVTFSVTDLHVLLTAGTVTEGSNVTLTCDTSCNLNADITFIWYKNTRPTRHRAINNTLHLNPVSSEDAGSYSCAVRGHEQHRSPDTALDVRYAPRNTTVIVALGGESVNLTCRSDANPPVHTYTWYRKTGTQTSLLGGGQSYVVANISYETSGLYYCVAQNSVGEQHSAAVSVPIAGRGSTKYAAIWILVVVALLLLPGLLCLSRRKSNAPPTTRSATISQQADSNPVYDDVLTSDPSCRRNTEAGDDVQYANVKFKGSDKAEVGPYVGVQRPRTQTAQEDVQYASVNFSRPKDTSQAEEDPVIYSTVNKPSRT
ncbi:B-cell receptor CD22-like isoform X2 [Alosa sapidissima]|uniref:B-cell receptor CD22-like isoform X2 n=1 Tax=Alosa sapidissima TaxID=34773 RepID=UPI001C0A646D|nr:B-cell receptor CD22-like isoform X2 [Alosa sapidissima]